MIYDLIAYQAEKELDKPAIIDKDISISYGKLLELVTWLANGLRFIGIKAGDRLSFFGEDCYQEVIWYLACFKIGAIACPLYEGLRGKELEYIIKQTTPKLVITTFNSVKYLREIEAKVNYDFDIFVIENQSHEMTFGRLYEKIKHEKIIVNKNNPSLISYTSGSTGQPKGVVHSQSSLVNNSRGVIDRFNLESDTKTLVKWLDFNATLSSCLLTTLFIGGTVFISRSKNPLQYLDEIALNKINLMFSVPSTCYDLIEAKKQRPKMKHSLAHFIVGGDHYDKKLFNDFYSQFKINFTPGMGMTETLFQCSLNNISNDGIGSVGIPMPGVQLKILDAKGMQCETNKAGELYVSTPCMMIGYWNNPLETESVLQNGWLKTGDLGYIDEKDRLWIAGRTKNIIIVNGDNVNPMEVESILRSNDKVNHAVIIGKRKNNNDLIIGFVQLKRECTASEDEIIRFCQTRLPDFKVPYKVIFVDDFKKNSRGKIDRIALKELLAIYRL